MNESYSRKGMIERDNHEPLDLRTIEFINLDDIPDEAIRITVYESSDGTVSYFREREYFYWFNPDVKNDVSYSFSQERSVPQTTLADTFVKRITDTRYQTLHVNTTIDGTNYVVLTNIYCQKVNVELNKFRHQYSLN